MITNFQNIFKNTRKLNSKFSEIQKTKIIYVQLEKFNLDQNYENEVTKVLHKHNLDNFFLTGNLTRISSKGGHQRY